jgi:hypothetical protein
MDNNTTFTLVAILILAITLLNLGLVFLALSRLNGLRKDLRTPVVKKFNQDFKRKPVDIPKPQEFYSKTPRDDKQNRPGNQTQNRAKNNPQQNRQIPRRPVAKIPEVFSNEQPPPPRMVVADSASAMEGRRPLPPRPGATVAFDIAPAVDLAPIAPVNPVINEAEDMGMEFDRSKIAHGRRNVVAKPVIEDDEGNV